MKSYGRVLFFVVLGGYIAATVFIGLPAIHHWHDPLVARDTGTIWDTLTWNIQQDGTYSIPVALFCSIEGPLQVLFLNAYCYLVGDIVPLTPVVTQIPLAILTFLCALFFYKVGTKIHSEQLGYLSSILFVLSPWVALHARMPAVVILLSVLFELAILYYYTAFLEKPDQKWYRIAAPLSLAFYLTVALDWPSFLFVLFLYLLFHKKFFLAVKNPYNVIPLLILGIYLLSEIIFRFNGVSCNAFTLFIRPFGKVLGTRQTYTWIPSDPTLSNILIFAYNTLGIQGILALIGSGLIILQWRKHTRQPEINRTGRILFFPVMAIWFLVFSLPLFLSIAGYSPEQSLFLVSYVYVISIPSVILAARCLLQSHRIRFFSVVIVCVMIWIQWYAIITSKHPAPFGDTDQRTVAAATFLIEQRPDLLGEGKTALLAGDHAKAVGQYARGKTWIIALHENFPHILATDIQHGNTRYAGRIGTRMLLAYTTQKKLQADWLVLTPELLTPGPHNQSAEFYQLLASDPQIDWIACFQDTQKRTLWLGEVKPDGKPITQAPIYEVEPLAEQYQQKYNRISFLKRNVRYILHY